MVEDLGDFRGRGRTKQLYRLLELVLISAAAVLSFTYILYTLQNLNAPVQDLLLDFRLVLSLVLLVSTTIVHLRGWKMRVVDAKEDLVHMVAYRSETPINVLAERFNLSKGEVSHLIEQLVDEGRLTGEIRGNFFYASLTSEPECALCQKEITTSERFLNCPHCRIPYHKDCLIDYINDVEERCPKCGKRVTLADIFGE
ncbi:MAG: RING finger protein [Promethearchaeota archaeon]